MECQDMFCESWSSCIKMAFFLSVRWARFRRVCKFKKIGMEGYDNSRELSLPNPECQDTYSSHPYCFRGICIPLRNRVCRFCQVLWDSPSQNSTLFSDSFWLSRSIHTLHLAQKSAWKLAWHQVLIHNTTWIIMPGVYNYMNIIRHLVDDTHAFRLSVHQFHNTQKRSTLRVDTQDSHISNNKMSIA